MIEWTEHDFQPMEEFSLKWRWTDARWNQLPASALTQIQPFVAAKSNELNRYSLGLIEKYRLSDELFNDISDIDDRDNTNNSYLLKDWLKQKDVKGDEQVAVSWDGTTAVLTNRNTFCEYWDDFCYPASDDVLIFSSSEPWALFYWHEEILFFGLKCSDS